LWEILFVKIKTYELTGAALNWAVAMAEGFPGADIRYYENTKSLVLQYSNGPKGWLLEYSTNWSQGGPIIERECIDVLCLAGGDDGWQADKYLHTEKVEGYGPTPLIAAMRCYVASKLGDEIDVPKELL
jgi:hypothetical protein